MAKRFETGRGVKMAEEDSWEHGCVIGTESSSNYDETFEADSLDKLLVQLKDHFDVTMDAILLDSCDEAGRIDIQRIETGDSDVPSAVELCAWKQGKLKLWAATYTYYVEVVNRHAAALVPIMKFEGVDR
jgi:hypothetical protein